MTAQRLTDFANHPRKTIHSLFSESGGSKLYIKVTYYCPVGIYTQKTIFVTDGTAESTMDLQDSPCSSSSTTSPHDVHIRDRYAAASTVLLGVLPMVGLASFVLVTRKLPGVLLNILGGIFAAICLLYVAFGAVNRGETFFKWTATVYTAILWICIVAACVTIVHRREWQDELITWAVAIVAPSFFYIVHIDLNLPWTDGWLEWAIFTAIVSLHAAASMLISRIIPLVLFAIGTFEIALRISYTLVAEVLGLEGQLQLLIMFALFAVEGIGIILGAIFYASRRSAVETSVRAFLRGSDASGASEASDDSHHE